MQDTSSSPLHIHTNLPLGGQHGETECTSTAWQDTVSWESVSKDRGEIGSSCKKRDPETVQHASEHAVTTV